MPNLVITSTAKRIIVDFNDSSEKVGYKRGSFRRDYIEEVLERYDANFITVVMLDGREYDLTVESNHNHALTVDSIDTQTSVDNDELMSKLEALQEI